MHTVALWCTASCESPEDARRCLHAARAVVKTSVVQITAASWRNAQNSVIYKSWKLIQRNPLRWGGGGKRWTTSENSGWKFPERITCVIKTLSFFLTEWIKKNSSLSSNLRRCQQEKRTETSCLYLIFLQFRNSNKRIAQRLVDVKSTDTVVIINVWKT